MIAPYEEQIPPIKWPVRRHATLDSTSDEARRMVERGDVSLPFVVRADRQTRGRGRGGNLWWSDDGSLLVTVALDPISLGLPTCHQVLLGLTAAIAVFDALMLHFCLFRGGIRWPNDVEYGGRKLAGVLPEHVDTPHGPRVLVGVGINVATSFDEAPPDVRALAISVRDLYGPVGPSDSDDLLAWFCDFFASRLSLLATGAPGLVERFRSLDQLAGRPVRVRQVDRIIEGIGRGIDADGALILETDHGLETIVGGQVLRDS